MATPRPIHRLFLHRSPERWVRRVLRSNKTLEPGDMFFDDFFGLFKRQKNKPNKTVLAKGIPRSRTLIPLLRVYNNQLTWLDLTWNEVYCKWSHFLRQHKTNQYFEVLANFLISMVHELFLAEKLHLLSARDHLVKQQRATAEESARREDATERWVLVVKRRPGSSVPTLCHVQTWTILARDAQRTCLSNHRAHTSSWTQYTSISSYR